MTTIGSNGYEFKTAPMQHQFKIWEETKDKQSWAYFMEMGTGKTKVTIDTFAHLYEQGSIDSVVVMAKKGEYANWSRYEIPKHLPDRIKREVLLFSSYKAKTKPFLTAQKNLMKPGDRLRILVINIESIAFGGKKVLDEFYKSSKRGVMLVIDESTCVKHYDSKRSKEAYQWAFKAKYRRIMTGTAVTQSPMDLWGQCCVLGLKQTLKYPSYFVFRNTYCVMETQYLGPRQFQKVVGYQHLEELAERIKGFSHQVLKEDCIDIPPKVYTQRIVEMTPKQQQIYEQLRDEALLELDGHEVEVVNVLAQITKLHQVVCGQLKVGDDEYISIENDRLAALLDVLESFTGKAIIWASYRQTLIDVIATLQKEYGEEAVVGYFGGVDDKKRAYAIEAFMDPTSPVRFFVANPQSAGYGITLTAATLEVYYSNSYNLEHRMQSEDRAHRIGQTKSLTICDLVTPDTVDERILEVLRSKKKISDIVLSRPTRSWF